MASCGPKPVFTLLILTLLALLPLSWASDVIVYQSNDGEKVLLQDNRRPSLYTRDFGDCLGSSLIDVTSFDASYYADNMTVTFDIKGSTNLTKEALMSKEAKQLNRDKSLTAYSLHRRLCVW
jgi:hypothetical protein